MIPLTTYAGRKVAVFGLGLSGRVSAHALMAGGADVVGWDDGAASRDAAHADGIKLVDLRDANWSEFSALVLAPGVPLTHPEPHWTVQLARNSQVPIIGDTELFFLERAKRAPDAGVVAITGTNGKSTVTALTTHLLSDAGFDVEVGGNIGEAVLGLPDFAPGKIYVLEMSSYQLDLTPSVAPNAAALLNITPDHIDRHGTIENYAGVKAGIFSNLGEGDAALISLDDRFCETISRALTGAFEKIEISSRPGVASGFGFSVDGIWPIREGIKGEEIRFTKNDALRGLHNKQNAAFAFELARHMGANPEALQVGLSSFPGLAHRMEIVGRVDDHLLINDSKATNAEAAAQALAAFDDIYWIVGGRGKDGGLDGLEAFYGNVRKAYLIGECAGSFASQLEGRVEFEDCGDIERAVARALEDMASAAIDKSVLLLSPAAASFDQYTNFEQRGDAFCEVVRGRAGVEMIGGRR